MDIEEAYRTGFWKTYDQKINNWEAAHLSGLHEIARQQAEKDALLADRYPYFGYTGAPEIARVIRAQFEN